MKIKRFFKSSGFVGNFVVEKTDGTFARFRDTPFRVITEQDLTPVIFYQARGHHAEDMPEYMYKFYGFTKSGRSNA